MTMKPKAKKFRTRNQPEQPADEPFMLPSVDELGETPDIGPRPTPKPNAAPPATPANPANTLEAIRREGLTGRQLRMARRAAQRHNLPATSDFDAVRLLRDKGIDPFQRSNMLELVQPNQQGGTQAMAKIDPVQLPQTVKEGENLPSTELENEDPAARRAKEILEIQRDLTKRRQKRMLLLATRMAFFVGLPTLIAGLYFYTIATPMYSAKSSFLIQQNEAQAAGAGGGLGGMLGGGQLATVQDSIAVQGYLTSSAALVRLDNDLGWIEHFSGDNIDPLSRLDPGTTTQAALKIYMKNIKIGYDPTEGIINMEVIAATPEATVAFSEALIGYAEERVSNLTQRLREDQMKGARESYEEAEAARQQALQTLVNIQTSLEVVDPMAENGVIMNQIATLEAELTVYKRGLAELLENRNPNASRVSSQRLQIRLREESIANLRAEMVDGQNGNASMSNINAQLRVAEENYAIRNELLAQSLGAMEAARMSADRQARFLAPSIEPVAPDAPAYPRKFENTVLALLVFAGIYLMMSLTASILREQV